MTDAERALVLDLADALADVIPYLPDHYVTDDLRALLERAGALLDP